MKSRLVLFAGAAMLLAACGQKGALFLPDEQRNVAVTPAGSSTAAPAAGNSTPDAAPDAPAAPAAPADAVPQASPAPAAPADPADPQTRRSNTAPRTN